MVFSDFLMGMAGPIAARVLITLGIGTVTFTGVTQSLDGVIALATSSWSGVSPVVLQLAGLAGIPECLGIITGAMSSRVAIWASVSATRFVLTPAS